jgi:hypothetical protein
MVVNENLYPLIAKDYSMRNVLPKAILRTTSYQIIAEETDITLLPSKLIQT